MSEVEKGAILKALITLPEDAKNFLLGFAAGRAAADAEKKHEDSQKEAETV